MKSSIVLATTAIAAIVSTASASSADNTTQYTALCEGLYNFTGDQEAVTKVTFVNYVPYNATTDVPGYCNTTGYINGYTGFQIVLPANASQYKNIMTAQGCGGSCGTYQMWAAHPIFATAEKPDGEGTAAALLRRGYIASSVYLMIMSAGFADMTSD